MLSPSVLGNPCPLHDPTLSSHAPPRYCAGCLLDSLAHEPNATPPQIHLWVMSLTHCLHSFCTQLSPLSYAQIEVAALLGPYAVQSLIRFDLCPSLVEAWLELSHASLLLLKTRGSELGPAALGLWTQTHQSCQTNSPGSLALCALTLRLGPRELHAPTLIPFLVCALQSNADGAWAVCLEALTPGDDSLGSQLARALPCATLQTGLNEGHPEALACAAQVWASPASLVGNAFPNLARFLTSPEAGLAAECVALLCLKRLQPPPELAAHLAPLLHLPPAANALCLVLAALRPADLSGYLLPAVDATLSLLESRPAPAHASQLLLVLQHAAQLGDVRDPRRAAAALSLLAPQHPELAAPLATAAAALGLRAFDAAVQQAAADVCVCVALQAADAGALEAALQALAALAQSRITASIPSAVLAKGLDWCPQAATRLLAQAAPDTTTLCDLFRCGALYGACEGHGRDSALVLKHACTALFSAPDACDWDLADFDGPFEAIAHRAWTRGASGPLAAMVLLLPRHSLEPNVLVRILDACLRTNPIPLTCALALVASARLDCAHDTTLPSLLTKHTHMPTLARVAKIVPDDTKCSILSFVARHALCDMTTRCLVDAWGEHAALQALVRANLAAQVEWTEPLAQAAGAIPWSASESQHLVTSLLTNDMPHLHIKLAIELLHKQPTSWAPTTTPPLPVLSALGISKDALTLRMLLVQVAMMHEDFDRPALDAALQGMDVTFVANALHANKLSSRDVSRFAVDAVCRQVSGSLPLLWRVLRETGPVSALDNERLQTALADQVFARDEHALKNRLDAALLVSELILEWQQVSPWLCFQLEHVVQNHDAASLVILLVASQGSTGEHHRDHAVAVCHDALSVLTAPNKPQFNLQHVRAYLALLATVAASKPGWGIPVKPLPQHDTRDLLKMVSGDDGHLTAAQTFRLLMI